MRRENQLIADARERQEKEIELMKKVDEVIKSVSDRVIKENCLPEEYPSTVMALARLVEARAMLN